MEAKSSIFQELFPPRTQVQRLATGFQFTEGPVWIAETSSLLFSDIPGDTIYQWAAGKVAPFRHPSHHANGLTRDRQGRLITCEHGLRRLTRTEQDGSLTVLADRFEGKPLNSPNDVVVRRDGTIYFTDPPYGIEPEQQEQPVQGVYCLSTDGTLNLVAQDFVCPNGLAFSPDETKLYIGDSEQCHVRVFRAVANGSLQDLQIVYSVKSTAPGVPDGIKVDQAGRFFCTGPKGIWVFSPQGEHLGSLELPEQPANLAWGDEDNCGLYITACTSVYKIRVVTPGIAVV
jgi:gluconolactonase